jgi:AcrR family transcriptional regulator
MKALRADARDNRARILSVAEEVFGRAGESASTEEVARLAGVGIATVFRHFPTKGQLLEAVLVGRLERLRDQAVELTAKADPGDAFFAFFKQIVADAAGKIAITQALSDAVDGAEAPDAERASAELRSAVGGMLEQAKHAGAVRTDVELPELYALLIGVSRAAVKLDPAARDRMMAIVFAGLARA